MKPIQHWKCEICKGYNDILNMSCSFCKADVPSWITAKYQMSVEFDRGIFDSFGVLASARPAEPEGRVKKLLMTPNEELHAKFFSEEAVLVLDLSDADLDEHIHELETIAREAKARILAASQEKRTRAAKSGNKAWKVEPLGPDPTVTESLNKVKQRSGRMSKLDGMRAKMAALGIPDSELDQMMAKMVAQARKDPKALKEEARLKAELKEPPQPPTIVTEEERLARIQRRRDLDAEDARIEKEEKEKKEAELAPVHKDKDEKLILAEEPTDILKLLTEEPPKAPVPAPSEPNNGKPKATSDWLARLKKK